jgi:energy-coupling factor transporter ATP-binding protein EcfA2
MRILSLNCSKLHGYISFNLNFNSSLTFITGINGSGKTSAVRAVTALLTPSLRELANLAYESVEVVVDHEDNTRTVRSERDGDEIKLRVSGVDEVLKIPILRYEVYEPRSRFLERENDYYREQEALHFRHPVLLEIESLPTPMFLDLERRHQSGSRRRRESVGLSGRPSPANPLAGSLVDSLLDAQSLSEDTFRRTLAERTALTDRLKQEIILTAFEPYDVEYGGYSNFASSRAFLRQIERKRDVVLGSLRGIGIDEASLASTVEPFFDRVRDVGGRLPTEKKLQQFAQSDQIDEQTITSLQEWSAIQPQARQINRLLELIERYNAQVQAIFEPIARYLTSVNRFLGDSGKELSFDSAGNLQVQIEEYGKARSIGSLSSGERQLVVILTHLAFNRQAKRANVLIIDEPELSLHIKWQELFVDAVLGAGPDLQLILATHSPSIILERVASCVDVEEARSDRVLS